MAPNRHPSSATEGRRLEGLKPAALMQSMFKQPLSLWFAMFYLLFEYVRPQALYPAIDVLPWGLSMLALGTLFCLLEGRLSTDRWQFWALFLLFTAVILASSVAAFMPSESYRSLEIWWGWLLAILLISSAIDTTPKLILTVCAFLLYNFKMSQHSVGAWASVGFGFARVGASGSPGWFRNSGEFGIAMCVMFPISLYLTLGAWPTMSRIARVVMAAVTLSAVIGMVASSSRGALFGGGVLAVWFVMRSPNRLQMMGIAAALAPLVWLIVPSQSKARWAAAGTDPDSIRRLTYWADGIKIANDFPLLGIGYKNWLPYYRAYFNPEGEVQHNIFIECVSELGYVGLIVFVLLLIWSFVETGRVRKQSAPEGTAPNRMLFYLSYGLDGALIGYLASGFFVTVLFYPFFWINSALVMGLSRAARWQRSQAPTGTKFGRVNAGRVVKDLMPLRRRTAASRYRGAARPA